MKKQNKTVKHSFQRVIKNPKIKLSINIKIISLLFFENVIVKKLQIILLPKLQCNTTNSQF